MSHAAGHGHVQTPWLGIGLGAALLVVAGGLPLLVTADPLTLDLNAAFAPPSPEWLLGADQLGRSVLARVAAGARLSLGLAAGASVLTAAIGVIVGLLAAAKGGLSGRILMGLADTVYVCPSLLFVLLAAGLFGGGIWTVLLGLILTRWPGFARLCLPLAQGALLAPDAEASRLLGFGTGFLLLRHAWPAVRGPVGSLVALSIANNILSISSLGFLGIGLAPPEPEWGAMIAEALPYLRDAPHLLVAPALGVCLATWSATLIAGALTEWQAPRTPESQEALA